MEMITTSQSGNFNALKLDRASLCRLSLELDHALSFMSGAEQKQVQRRMRLVTEGWSEEVRAARIREGIARQTWLLKSIGMSLEKTDVDKHDLTETKYKERGSQCETSAHARKT